MKIHAQNRPTRLGKHVHTGRLHFWRTFPGDADHIRLAGFEHGDTCALLRYLFKDNRFVLGNADTPVVVDSLQLNIVAVLAFDHLIWTAAHGLAGKAFIAYLLGICLGLDHTLRALNIGELPGQKRRGILGRDNDLLRAIRFDLTHLLAQPPYI